MELQKIAKEVPSLIKVAKVVFPKWDDEQAENYVVSELSFLRERIENDYGLAECTTESLVQCFKKAMRDNVSLNKSANLVYIQPQGLKKNGQWTKVATYSLTAEGKISVVRQSGMLIDITRPKLFKNAEGKVIGGEIELLKPSYPKPRWECIDFDESDINRWKRSSHLQKAKTDEEKADKSFSKANALYFTGVAGGIDSEFMRAKIIKHALAKGLGTNVNESVAKNQNTPVLDVVDSDIDEEDSRDKLPSAHEFPPVVGKDDSDVLKDARPDNEITFDDL